MTRQSPNEASVEAEPTADSGDAANDGQATAAGPHKTKALSVNLDEDLLRRLRVIAVLRDTSVSALIESYLASQVRRDLKKVVAKLAE
jgi:predicted  nucleic acid-binding Zn-ribbon protein